MLQPTKAMAFPQSFPEGYEGKKKEKVEEKNCFAGCSLRLEGCQHWNDFAAEEAEVEFQECHF